MRNLTSQTAVQMLQSRHEQYFVNATDAIDVSVQWLLDNPLRANALETRGYRLGYDALIRLAARTDWNDPNAVLAMMYAVYGWMPTILKVADDWKNSTRILGELITDLHAHEKSKTERYRILTLAAERHTLLSVNHSVIGTSKLLHFACPDFCPIWDKKIATRFGYLKPDQSHNNQDAYILYTRAIHAWLDEYSSRLEALGDFAGHQVGYVRQVEFALFLAAGAKALPNSNDEPN